MADVAPPRELRLALAMKGGVSLAVWMGGACREIARMREDNALPPPESPDAGSEHQPRYQALLRLCGYDSVLVDVLSGSSAGGLNGVLLSQHIASGARFDDGVRDVWLRVGDLHQLARRPWSDPPLSLLHGDQGFYRQLVRAMRQLRTRDPRRAAAHPLRLLVTATRLHGRTDALFPSIGEPLVARSNEGFCRFRYPGIADALYLSRQARSDHDVNDFVETDEGDRRLAYAARTTSSFPGAFEPASPWVASRAADEEVDLYGISSETGTEDPGQPGRVELVDGGLLDNIPIAWAVRSIAGMPAVAPVDRWLLYLEPVPDKKFAPDKMVAPEGSEQDSHTVLGMIKLVTTSLLVRSSTESVLDDAQVLTETAGLADAQRSSMVASLALAGSEGLREAAAEQIDPAYLQLLGQMEISRLRQLLLDPFALVGPDPLPVPPNTFASDQLRVLDEVGTAQVPLLRPVPDAEAALFAGPLQSTDVLGALGLRAQTPMVAARAVTLLLEAVRTAERQGTVAPAGVRDRLYALRLATEMVVAARDRALLNGASDHLRRPSTDEGIPPAIALLQQANRQVGTMIGRLEELPAGGDNLEWARFWRRWAYDLAALAVDGDGPDTGGSDPGAPYAALWEGVLGCREAFALIGAAERDMAETLCSLEVLVGGQRPDPLSAPAVPRFAVMSAGNRSPLEARLLPGGVTDANRVDRKLSGNQVANFAGFLSARWRHNDWIWGRLDGAQSLTTVIATPERIARALLADADTADPRRALREFFVGGSADPAWTHFYAHRWSELESELAVGSRPVEEWFVDVATERLQWDILAAEMGRFHQLNDRSVGRDDPPDTDLAPAPSAPPLERLDALGAVGAESVLSLVRRAELRRTLVQLALIVWRAVVGTSGAKRVAGWAMAPIIVTPLVLCLVSPFSTVFAAIFSWLAISAVTGVVASVAHLPVIIGLALASFVIAAHLRGGDHWPLRLAPIAVIILGFAAWLVVFRLGWVFPVRSAVAQATWTGLASGAAFGVTQVDAVWASLRRRKRELSPLWLVGAILVVAVIAALLTVLPDHAAVGFALQYVALALGLVGLYLWTEKSATRQQPLDPWPDDEMQD